MMDENFYANLRKAARAGMTHYATADDWELAQHWYVTRNRTQHESFEAAFARLLNSDAEMQAMDRMRRMARDTVTAKRGRPRKHKPQNVHVSKAESRLFDMAAALAIKSGVSFERAFVQVIDSDAGAELYQQVREAR